MKLFFKHLKNSIKRKPIQPLILILTLALAMVVITACINVGIFINGETDERQVVEYGTADFTVSLNATSKSRFMFSDKAEEILENKAKVVGLYDLPVYFSQTNQTAFGVAVDFYDVEQVFEFEFIEHLPITSSSVNESALVSLDFAEKYNLGLGDSFTVNVLGYDKTYTIKAISKIPFMGSYELMVNVTGVMRLLASDSLLVSSLGDSFKPSNTLYVNVLEDGFVNDCITALKNDADFSDKTFQNVANIMEQDGEIGPMNTIVYVLIALSLMLSVAVVFCCFYIISNERTGENALFKALGATASKMNLLQYAEIGLYWLIGAPIGLALSIPFSKLIYRVVGFRYFTAKFSPLSFVISSALTLVISVFTAFVFIISERRPKKLKKQISLYKYTLPAFLLTFILTITLPVKARFILCCISEILLFITIFTGVPVIFKWITSVIDKILCKRQIKNNGTKVASFGYAVKNVKQVRVLQNSCRLLSVILVVIFTILTAVNSADIVINNYKSWLNADFAIPNSTASCREKIEKLDSVENVYSILMTSGTINDMSIKMLSISDVNALSDTCDLDRTPTGNELFVPLAICDRQNLKIGDIVYIQIGESQYEFKVSKLRKDNINVVIFNSEYFGLEYDTLLADGVENIEKELLRNQLLSAIALEMTTIVDCKELFNRLFVVGSLYINSGWFILPMMILFAVIGMVDNVVISYRARREEFELYSLSGMSKKTVRRMIFFELLLTATFGLVLSLVSSLFAILLLDNGMRTFGYRMLLAFGIA
ncbi:MAG: ABC transporter permease [Clostridia bacterium]|nr:ABC transporter permease [Clostridia bacterium]